MNNMQMSTNVKQYFIHALKSIGLLQAQNNQYVEMSEKQIEEFLDNPQTIPQDIYNEIIMAVNFQLKVDEGNENQLKQNTEHERQTISYALVDNFQIDKARSDDYLKDICSIYNLENIGATARVIIEKIKLGINEQKDFKAIGEEGRKEKAEALSIWDDIKDCEYNNWLAQQPDPQNPQRSKEEFYAYNTNVKHIVEQTKNKLFNGDTQMAKNFLNSKFNEDAMNNLKVSDYLLERAKKNCRDAGRDPENDLTVGDVLVTLNDGAKVEQVMTYFHNRSKQQNEAEKSKKGDVTKSNKIGNILGKNGRKEIKNAVVYFDKEKAGKQGKKTWRGFKEMYDKISRLMNSLYGTVMAGGFTERMLKKAGYILSSDIKIDISKNVTNDKPWEVEIDKIPTQFVQDSQNQTPAGQTKGVAETFYEKARARLMADKVRIHHLNALLQDPNITEAKEKKFTQKLNYLKNRVTRSNQAIQSIPAKTDQNFDNQAFFDQLEIGILDEKNAKDPMLKAFIDSTKNNTANAELSDALNRFKLVAGGTTPNKQNAKIAMAMDLLGLGDKVNAKELNPQQVSEIADRFVANKLDNLNQQLTALSQNSSQTTNLQVGQQNCQISVGQAFKDMAAFTENDLQTNAMKESYIDAIVKQNRLKIQEAVAKEMS